MSKTAVAQPAKATSFGPPAHGILQRKCACGTHTMGGGECTDCAKRKSGLQRKLAIGASNDPLEREADRIAEQVMAAPVHSTVSGTPPRIQRITGHSTEENGAAPVSVERVIASGGRPLDPSLQHEMGQRFGHDFSGVRVHTGTVAEQSARELNALAYTVGRDVVFGAGEYAPMTSVGQKLLAHELTHVLQQGGVNRVQENHDLGSVSLDSSGLVQRQSAPRPTSENVWGLLITRSMCGCRQQVRDGIAWANTAGATYATCDTPANPTSSDVEACFAAAHPGTTVAGSTSSSGTMTLPPPSADPCQRIDDKAIFVHETMHSRHTDDMARAQGAAFFREWRRLAGDPDRLDKLRPTFPTQVAAFEAQWDNGHDWAQDEVNSYRWHRRFLENALAALNRIC